MGSTLKNTPRADYHTVEDDWLASYASGGLSAAKRFVIACQAAINPTLSGRLDNMDMIGGALLESAHGEAVSDNFLSNIFERIDMPEAVESAPADVTRGDTESWVPAPLSNFLAQAGQSLTWKNMGFGMARLP